MELFNKIGDVKILVIGDIMLDRYISGEVTRISPEAPVPIVRLKNTSLTAGGAANVAANVIGLGAQAYLIGIIGDDAEGEIFPQVLRERKISAENLLRISNRPTTIKTRIIAHNQQIVRVDQETNVHITEAEEDRAFLKASEIIDEVGAVLISDYNKGFLSENLLSRLIRLAMQKGKRVLVDPKGRNYDKYKGATLLTPNKFEVAEVQGNGVFLDEESLSRAGTDLLNQLELEALLITRGEEGMTLLEKNQLPVHLSATARDVYDVTGAGDTVIATFSTVLTTGETFRRAAEISNAAAGLVVSELGTSVVNVKQLKSILSQSSTDELTAGRAGETTKPLA